MAIMAVVAAISMPGLAKTLATVQLQADARQMASTLRLARQQAMTTGQPATVVFYPANGKYKLLGANYVYLRPGIRYVGLTTFTSKIGGQPACGFSPGGEPSSGGTVALGNGYENRYVIVNPVAGRIRISASPPANW